MMGILKKRKLRTDLRSKWARRACSSPARNVLVPLITGMSLYSTEYYEQEKGSLTNRHGGISRDQPSTDSKGRMTEAKQIDTDT